MYIASFFSFFFFNDTATTEIYTLSLHDALPIYLGQNRPLRGQDPPHRARTRLVAAVPQQEGRIDLRAHGRDHPAHPAGRYADRAAHVAGSRVPHRAEIGRASCRERV